MDDDAPQAESYSLFAGDRRVAEGDLGAVTDAAREASAGGVPVIAFANATGRVVDIDLRGPAPTASPPKPSRGRPRLGVVAREVTLLPRHWDWLQHQPGGASATLRRLVETARREGQELELRRNAREAAHRAMTTLAGNLPGYEAALRALYAGDADVFLRQTAAWPSDINAFVSALAAPSWAPPAAPSET